tara:strand:- start:133 stop:489 length:357 start_codon:yes stop_codon:yes gene_type:complete
MGFQNVTVSNLPLIFPIRQILTTTTLGGNTITVSFPDQYLGIAVALKITNNSGANAATYSYNLNTQFSNLAASSFDTLDGTQIKYITVNTPSAIGDSVLVEAQVLPIPKNDPPPMESL